MEFSPGEQAFVQTAPLAVITLILSFFFWTSARILHKAGYSGWWSLLALIPAANLVMLWVFAFSDWPALKART